MERPSRLALIGRQGSGKGTQARLLAERLRLAHLSTGDLLRDEAARRGPASDAIRGYLDAGALVPDGIIDGVVARAIGDCSRGFVLDGYPRTRSQVDFLDRITDLDVVIELDLPANEAAARLLLRRVCVPCGETAAALGSSDDVRCPSCEQPMSARSDDHPVALQRRLELYEQATAPVLEIYAQRGILQSVDAHGAPAAVADRVFRAIGRPSARRIARRDDDRLWQAQRAGSTIGG